MTATLRKLLKKKAGILLDISLGGTPQARSVVMSVDLKHSPLTLPFPLPNGCVNTAVVTHVLEYLDPALYFAWWDELHRVMQPQGICHISGPYGGDDSYGWLSDPSHRTRIIETSFAWLDDRTPLYAMHDGIGRTRPKIWHPLGIARVPGTQASISYNATLQAQK